MQCDAPIGFQWSRLNQLWANTEGGSVDETYYDAMMKAFSGRIARGRHLKIDAICDNWIDWRKVCDGFTANDIQCR